MSDSPGVPVPVPAGGAPAGVVRLTVHPGEDVEVRGGVTVGELRAPLAALLRRPELHRAALEADGVPLGDGDVVGRRPLLAGATVRVAARSPGGAPEVPAAAADEVAVRAAWVLSRETGPAAGELAALRGPTTLAGGGARVRVRPDARRPGRVQVRRAPRARGAVSLVGPRTGTAADAGTPPGAGRRRRVGLLPRRWRPGAALVVGGTAYGLHRSGDVVAWLAPDPPATVASAPGTGVLAGAAVPVVGSLVLAATLRQPAYALFSLVGLLALVPQLVGLARRRRAARADGTAPAGSSAGGAAPGASAPPEPGSAPAALLARLVAAHQASDGAWRRATAAHASRARAGASGGLGEVGGVGTAAPQLPDGALAVRGPLEAVRAVARAVVVDLAAHGASVEVTGPGRAAWEWCRWLPGHAGGRLVVVDVVGGVGGVDGDGDGDAASALAEADAARRRGADVVLCLPGGATPPAWCRAVVTVHGDGRVRRVAPDGTDTVAPLVGVTPAWAERAARRLAGLGALRRGLADLSAPSGPPDPTGTGPTGDVDPTDPRLPAAVPLLGLLDGVASLGAAWRSASGWTVPLGVGVDGRPVELDLVADGPHLLVAGTTGAGKSELLQTLVLGLALRRSPADLALALVDFKGGASFGACGRLPHVVGQVTDLEPGLAGRALAGLRAELQRRERLLAAHGVADAADLPAGTVPRLVVVVDEFRALADDLPEFLPGLLRVAAQGRSLGVHLVLATQRPAGAVSADVRANVSARLALRVVDAADSHDVVDTGAAARIPVGTPGRAVLRVGAGAPVALQCAHAGGLPDDVGPVVRRATPWSRGSGPGVRAAPAPADRRRADPADVVTELVGAARSTAARLGLAPGTAPWLPPLPARARPGDADGADGADADLPPGALPLALGDDPARQRRVVVGWDPVQGHLAVIGRARSGRTTALLTLARAALERGWHVHALVPPAAAGTFAPLVAHPGFGTLAGPDDPRRAGRLLRVVSTSAPAEPSGRHGTPVLVVVDGVEELRSVLAGADRWDPLTTALAAGRAAFALTAEGATVGGVASRVGPRLVLLGTDKHADVVLGAPSELAGAGGPPGRGAWLGTDGALVCQVFLPALGAQDGWSSECGPLLPPPRLRPLPAAVHETDLASAGEARTPAPTEVVVGLGGDDAGPVALDAAAGALVVGPRGSGRTALLRLVARRLARTGRLGGVVARDRELLDDAAGVPSSDHAGAALRDLLARLDGAPGDAGVLVVDDLDVLAQTAPVEAEQLGALVAQGWAVVASATTTGALLAHRGVLAELRGRRTGVVLAPGERGSDEVLGAPLADAVDPGPPRPGRGALVRPGAVVPLQVALPGGPGSVVGGVDDRTGHDQEQHRRGDEHERDAARDGPERSGAQQRDADQTLQDLPRHDGRAPAPTPRPQGAGGREQDRRDAEEEHGEEEADRHRAGTAADELDQHRAGRDAEEHGLERDRAHDQAEGDRVRRRTGARRLGRDDSGGHHTPRYVRPGVSRQCDQGLTVHSGETSP